MRLKLGIFIILGLMLVCSVASAAYIEVKNMSEYCDGYYFSLGGVVV